MLHEGEPLWMNSRRRQSKVKPFQGAARYGISDSSAAPVTNVACSVDQRGQVWFLARDEEGEARICSFYASECHCPFSSADDGDGYHLESFMQIILNELWRICMLRIPTKTDF